MGKNDMDHMQHIESVALSDCAVLQHKESTYQGSWKRAGGRSAWFMARRNLDRLITMMSPKEFSPHVQTPANVHDTLQMLENIVHYNGNAYTVKDLPGSIDATMQIIRMVRDSYFSEDIFRKIAEAPGGEDGTVLACLRDARRYFTLVEAEMIAEGVVEPESKTYEMETAEPYQPSWDGIAIDTFTLQFGEGNKYTWSGLTKCLIERENGACTVTIAPPGQLGVSVRDPYEVVAEENGMTVGQLKEYLLDHKHPTPPPSPSNGGYATAQRVRHPAEHKSPWTDVVGARLRVGDACTYNYRGAIVECTIVCSEDNMPVVKGENLPDEGVVVTDGTWLRRDSTKDNGEEQNHAKTNPLTPWQITQSEYESVSARVGATADFFYTRRAPDLFQLEAVVGSRFLPKELAECYDFAGDNRWVLKKQSVPSDLRENYRELQVEMNKFEHETSHPDYRFMYDWVDGAQKFILREQFRVQWGKDQA